MVIGLPTEKSSASVLRGVRRPREPRQSSRSAPLRRPLEAGWLMATRSTPLSSTIRRSTFVAAKARSQATTRRASTCGDHGENACAAPMSSTVHPGVQITASLF